MTFDLPVSGKKVVLKEFMPHGVYAKVQAALMRDIRMDMSAANPTMQHLVAEFGAEKMAEIEKLRDRQYEQEVSKLKEEYTRRQLKLDGLNLENVNEANMLRAEGMIETLVDKIPTRKDLDDLPEPDFQSILTHITEIENVPLGNDSGEPSGK